MWIDCSLIITQRFVRRIPYVLLLSFFFPSFFQNMALSSRCEAAHRTYTIGSDIGAATIIDPQISPTLPVIFTGGSKSAFLALSLTNARP